MLTLRFFAVFFLCGRRSLSLAGSDCEVKWKCVVDESEVENLIVGIKKTQIQNQTVSESLSFVINKNKKYIYICFLYFLLVFGSVLEKHSIQCLQCFFFGWRLAVCYFVK